MNKLENALHAFSLTTTDLTMIGVGTVLMFLLYKALEAKVFKPYLIHLELRESATGGASDIAAMMRQKSGILRARFDEALLHARIAATKDRVTVIAAAQEEAAKIVGAAEALAAGRVQRSREELSAQMTAGLSVADGEAAALAEMLASRVDSQLSQH